MRTSCRSELLILFLSALLVRIIAAGFLANVNPQRLEYQRDHEGEYLGSAMLAERAFPNPYLCDRHFPSAWRSPAHPALLMGALWIARGSEPAFLLSIQLLYSVVSALTVLGVRRLSAQIFGGRAGRHAGWIYMLYPPSIYYAIRSTSDAALIAALVVWTPLLVRSASESRSGVRPVLVGAFIGFAALVNPITIAVALPLLGWQTWLARDIGMRGVLNTALTGAVAVTCVLPWLIRNRIMFDEWIFIRGNFGTELMAGNRGNGHAYVGPDCFYLNEPAERALLEGLGEPAYNRHCYGRAIEWICADQGRFQRLCGRRILVFWTKEVFWGRFAAASSVLVGVPLALGAVGLLLGRRLGNSAYQAILPVLTYPLVYYITHAQARYRFPIDALLMTGIPIVVVSVATLGRKALAKNFLRSSVSRSRNRCERNEIDVC
ncbi:MAG: hypothetical protein FLDDKLPJ_03326 [Phycisphaerae bacterium]|nr:hypothetical protein [Phycisphaerae bacterium]